MNSGFHLLNLILNIFGETYFSEISAFFENKVLYFFVVIFFDFVGLDKFLLFGCKRSHELMERGVKSEELLEEREILIRKEHRDSEDLRFSELKVEISIVFFVVEGC